MKSDLEVMHMDFIHSLYYTAFFNSLQSVWKIKHIAQSLYNTW